MAHKLYLYRCVCKACPMSKEKLDKFWYDEGMCPWCGGKVKHV